tara:strand:- start:16823 stop:16999 length:177 start_codon:yes stop_codon:yes gene_type:complete
MSKLVSIKAKDSFEFNGLGFSGGVHNVEADLAASIIEAGLAKEAKRKAEKAADGDPQK